jgi:hypothetical protein
VRLAEGDIRDRRLVTALMAGIDLVTEQLTARSLILPCYTSFTEAEQDLLVSEILAEPRLKRLDPGEQVGGPQAKRLSC